MKSQQGSGEDDFAGTAGHHVAAKFSSEEEGGTQIGIDHAIPVFVGLLGSGLPTNRAGVVDQNVRAAMLCFDLVNQRGQGFPILEVAGQAHAVASNRSNRFLDSGALRFEAGRGGDNISIQITQVDIVAAIRLAGSTQVISIDVGDKSVDVLLKDSTRSLDRKSITHVDYYSIDENTAV